MTTEDLIKLAENYARLCYEGDDGPLVIDARQALLDALEAQEREVERMGRQILSDTDAFIHVRDQRDTLRAELAAIRAQEPVAWMHLEMGTCFSASNWSVKNSKDPLAKEFVPLYLAQSTVKKCTDERMCTACYSGQGVCENAAPVPTQDVGVLADLLQEVSRNFTREDDLPDGLLFAASPKIGGV